ncbi:hypothetical protein [Candidatus Solirubrobacter pratensis]|uniref:hypothetical protein n=1 Tax=Candidatus Solirubrobacter pratensis TaxID=1298857 RepID=UPI000488976A|nr:hypothetical protein [Candidatus Solirubrobacter pratensis]
MSDDWSPSKAFVRQVISGLAPKIEQSDVFLSLGPSDPNDTAGDVKLWVELGAAIMMDKPILAVVLSRRVSKRLRRVADEIVYAPNGLNDEVAKEIQAAMTRMVHKFR